MKDLKKIVELNTIVAIILIIISFFKIGLIYSTLALIVCSITANLKEIKSDDVKALRIFSIPAAYMFVTNIILLLNIKGSIIFLISIIGTTIVYQLLIGIPYRRKNNKKLKLKKKIGWTLIICNILGYIGAIQNNNIPKDFMGMIGFNLSWVIGTILVINSKKNEDK